MILFVLTIALVGPEESTSQGFFRNGQIFLAITLPLTLILKSFSEEKIKSQNFLVIKICCKFAPRYSKADK